MEISTPTIFALLGLKYDRGATEDDLRKLIAQRVEERTIQETDFHDIMHSSNLMGLEGKMTVLATTHSLEDGPVFRVYTEELNPEVNLYAPAISRWAAKAMLALIEADPDFGEESELHWTAHQLRIIIAQVH